jgi:hypothetical protein
LAEVCSICGKYRKIYDDVYCENRYLTPEEIIEKYKDCDVYDYKPYCKRCAKINQLSRDDLNAENKLHKQ